ncbi:MAG: glycosyl hydrolase [Bacteroidota bacterium]|nr:glycosyl hydrolase [Bacteroidota bacterium]
MMKKYTTFLMLTIVFSGLIQSVYAQKRSDKRGVSYDIPYTGDLPVLSQGVSWFYNWGTSPNSAISSTYSQYMDYFPMAWNGINATAVRAFKAAHPECKYILAFNEPNLTDQANMTPTQAAAKWPDLKAIATELNLKIISPAMNYGTLSGYSDPITWLDEFFTLVPLSDIDGIAIHCYMNDPGALAWYVGRFAKYHKPIWLTEFCSWEYNAPLTTNATVGYAYQRDGMVQKIEALELNPQVVKYAWFIPRTNNDGEFPYMQLLKKVQGTVPAGALTELGQIYVNMSSFDSTRFYGVNEKIAAKDYMRSYPVKLEASSDLASNIPIQLGSFDSNLFAEYFIDVPAAGAYPLTLRIANTAGVNPTFKISSNNVDLITQSVASTGGINNWDIRTINVNLAAGKQTLRITSTGTTGVKMQWLSFANSISGIYEIQESRLKISVDDSQMLQILCNERVLKSSVFDISGKMLLQKDNEQEINVGGLEKGVYILQVKLESGKILSSKFVINK